MERFAQVKFPGALPFLESALRRDPTSWSVISALIGVDGLGSLPRISSNLSSVEADHDNVCDAARHALYLAGEELGNQALLADVLSELPDDQQDAIEKLRTIVARYRRNRNVRNGHRDDSRRRRKDPSNIPFRDVWTSVEDQIKSSSIRSGVISTDSGYTSYREWGKHADDLQIEHAAYELSAHAPTDVARIARYAQVFAKRPYPLDPQILIDAIDTNIELGDQDYWISPEGWAVHCCLRALSNMSDSRISDMSTRLRNRSDHWRGYWTILFPPNDSGSYAELFEESMRSETDEEVIHSWGSDLCDRAGRFSTPAFARPLALLYDSNPCGVCRHDTVKLLHRIGALTDRMARECHYDSNESTREFVASIAGTPS